MHTHQHGYNGNHFLEFIGTSLPILLITFGYIIAAHYSNKKYRMWPIHRTVSWIIGVFCIVFALVGPLAKLSHTNFQAHMYTHLLLGMLGPLLLAFSAPITLLLRTLPIKYARILSKLLKSEYVRFVSHPITATILNIGGLWVLYTTELYNAMHTSTLLFAFIHFHVFLAGYIFTISMIYIDPSPHRTSFGMRAAVLVFAMAAHNILSKLIYANPPTGVEKTEGELGGMTMYYGGDFIDVMIVIALCYQYFKTSKARIEKKPIYGEVN